MTGIFNKGVLEGMNKIFIALWLNHTLQTLIET